MNISVIIPTLNAEATLAELITALKKQTLPFDIIIIDSSSTDKTLEIAGIFGVKVHSIDRKNFDHGGTRNLGLQLTSADFVVFMTQDAIPVNNRLIESLIEPLDDLEIAACFGRQIAKPDAIPPERFARWFNYPKDSIVKSKEDISILGIKTFFLSNVCSAFRREALEEIGGFPAKMIMNEDMITAARLILNGYKTAYCSTAEVWHSHNYTLLEQLRRNFDVGVSLAQSGFILDYAKSEVEGVHFAIGLFNYLIDKKQWRWVPYSALQLGFRYIGYRLGIAEKFVPLALKKSLSMHRGFWG